MCLAPLPCAGSCPCTTARRQCRRSHERADPRRKQTTRAERGRDRRGAADRAAGAGCGGARTWPRRGRGGRRHGRLPRQRAGAGIGPAYPCPAGRQPRLTGRYVAVARIPDNAGLGAQDRLAGPLGHGGDSRPDNHSSPDNGTDKIHGCGERPGCHTRQRLGRGAAARGTVGFRPGRTGAITRHGYRRGSVAPTQPAAACIGARPHSGGHADDAPAGLARPGANSRRDTLAGARVCTSKAIDPQCSATCAGRRNSTCDHGARPRPIRIRRDHSNGRDDLRRDDLRHHLRCASDTGTHDTARCTVTISAPPR